MQLRPEIAAKVVPAAPTPQTPIDYGDTVSGGEFDQFPNMPTTELEFTAGLVNMLADLTGWTVLNNADTFRRVLCRARRG